MAISTTALAIASFVVGAASAYNQYQQGQKSLEAQKQAQQAQSRAAQVAAQRERLQAMREARIKRAQILSSAGVQGVSGSGVQGSVSSIGSQLGANIGYMNVQEGFAQAASMANQQAANAMSSAASWQAIGGLAGKAFDASGGFTTIFGGNTTQKTNTSKIKTPWNYNIS